MTTDEVGFEESLRRLDRAVAALEDGELGLDEALARYEEGVRLLGRCKALLDAAERQVALLTGLDGDGTPQTVPFDDGPRRVE
jgi:exodeoxyribonuclease VII small subunit